MSIGDIQADALELCTRQQWQDRTRQQRFQYLISEIGELSTELVKLEWEGQDIAQLKQHIGHEMYDVVWNICDLANLLELDLEVLFEQKRQQNLKRSW